MLIDIHSHLYPPQYVARLRDNNTAPRVHTADGRDFLDIFPPRPGTNGGPGQPMNPDFDSVEAKLAFMERGGIDQSVISIGNPWVDFMPAAEAVAWASNLNEYVERICEVSGGRLYGLGIAPMQDLGAALTELDRIRSLPHIRGVVIPAKPLAVQIDSPTLLPFWEKAEALGLPVMIHPHYATGGDDLEGYGPVLSLVFGFPFESTVAAAKLILAGIPRRFPKLQLVLTHGGGTLPYLAGRLDNFTRGRTDGPPLSEDLRRFWVDGLVYKPDPLRCALGMVGQDRVMFGTDHPFGAPDGRALAAGIASAGLEAAVEQSIRSGAAQTLFGLK